MDNKNNFAFYLNTFNLHGISTQGETIFLIYMQIRYNDFNLKIKVNKMPLVNELTSFFIKAVFTPIIKLR